MNMHGGSGRRGSYFNAELRTQPVANPAPGGRCGRRVHNTALYRSARPDRIWIRHWPQSTAQLVSSVAMHQRCRPLYGTESNDRKRPACVYIYLISVAVWNMKSASRSIHFIPRAVAPKYRLERNYCTCTPVLAWTLSVAQTHRRSPLS
jgi:hypothetical protein